MVIGLSLLAVLATFGVFVAWARRNSAKTSREMADGTYAFRFVHVNEDGSARKLTGDEKVYLNTNFEGGDGARPYIKRNYRQLTPDNKIWGFLERRKLPRGMIVRSADHGGKKRDEA